MTDSSLLRPLYQRVYAVLLQRISEGEYPVGSALPSESRLSEEFVVSKATIRKAIEEMVARGYVTRRQGSGTYVTPSGLRPEEDVFVGSMDDLISGTPQLALHDVRVTRRARFPQDVREVFPSGTETGTMLRSRRRSGETIFVYSIHYLSPMIESLVTEEELGQGGLMSLLRRRGVRLTAAEQTMSARLADVEVADELGIGVGSPVLLARRVLYGDDGPVDVTRIWYRGDLFQWRASLRLEGDGAAAYSVAR